MRSTAHCGKLKPVRRAGRSGNWRGWPSRVPLLSTYTIGAEDPRTMAARALEFSEARAIKLKLIGDEADAERVRAVRAVRPEVWLAVDANQGFTPTHLQELMPVLTHCRVALDRAAVSGGQEPTLAELHSPIPIAADESAPRRARICPGLADDSTPSTSSSTNAAAHEGLRMAAAARADGAGES